MRGHGVLFFSRKGSGFEKRLSRQGAKAQRKVSRLKDEVRNLKGLIFFATEAVEVK